MPTASWTLATLLHAYVFYVGVIMMLALISVLVARDVMDVRLAGDPAPDERHRIERVRARLGRSIVPCVVGFAVTAVARVAQVLVTAL